MKLPVRYYKKKEKIFCFDFGCCGKGANTMKTAAFFIERWDVILEMTWEHCIIVAIAMTISIILGLLIGILISKYEKAANIVLNIASIMMTIPSLALFSIMIPILGIGKAPGIAGLVIYTQLPIIRNVYVGMKSIEPSILEAARGMGLSSRRILYKIQLPLAFPVIMAGIRTAMVMGIGVGSIAAYIGAGGLGQYIFRGINRSNDKMILIGAVMISLLTIITDKIFGWVQKRYEV